MHPRRRLRAGLPRAAAQAAAFAAAMLVSVAWAGPAMASAQHPHPRPSRHSVRPHPSATQRKSASRPRSAKSHASADPQPSHPGWVKYYIVQPPENGHEEFLTEIAAKTLGHASGNGAQEIFTLNKGRLQPGGGRLENPAVIQPGWILVLLASASGPGVHYGPLPVVGPSASKSATAAAPARARTAAGHGFLGLGSRRLLTEAVLGAAIILIMLLICGGLLLMRRLRRTPAAWPGRPGAAGPSRPGPGKDSRPRWNRRGRASPRSDAGRPATVPRVTVLASGLAVGGAKPGPPALMPPAVLMPSASPLAPEAPLAPAGARGGASPAHPDGQIVPPGLADQPGQPASFAYPAWLGGSPADLDGPTSGPAGLTDQAGPAVPSRPAMPEPLGPPGFAGLADPAGPGRPAATAGPPGSSAFPGMAAVPGSRVSPDVPLSPGPFLSGGPDDDRDLPWPDFLAPTGPGSGAACRPAAGLSVDWPVSSPRTRGEATADPGEAGTGGQDVRVTSAAQHTAVTEIIRAADPAVPVPDAGPDAAPRPVAPAGASGDDIWVPPTERPEQPFSPVALRILGAQRSSAQRAESADVPVQRHQVALGDDRIEVVLAEAPAVRHDGKPRSGHTWLTATPYLVWTPLPYDAPDDGVAFACLGAGDEGCLFIDLAAAPGAVAIGGDSGAAARLAESIAHQLCMASAAGQPCIVVVVGSALLEPHLPGATWIASVRDLASVATTGPQDGTEIVFCDLCSNDDAFALARYVGSAQRRVVPVVLANLPDAPWSFTAVPSRRPAPAPHPAVT